jgi:hypothetical protein
MNTTLYSDQLGWSGHGIPIVDDLTESADRAPVAADGRGLLGRLVDLVLGLLDLYVRWMGIDAPEPGVPQPPAVWTPYTASQLDPSLYQRGMRSRWWGC